MKRPDPRGFGRRPFPSRAQHEEKRNALVVAIGAALMSAILAGVFVDELMEESLGSAALAFMGALSALILAGAAALEWRDL